MEGSDDFDIVWLRPTRPPRDARSSLTRNAIVAAAIAIADTHGLDATSMRRIAAELGCGTMSLYRHVRDRDELIDLMVDAALAETDPPARPSGDWRADLRALAHRTRTTMRRHPWLAAAASARTSLGPNALRSLEYAMSAVDGRGLTIDEMLGVVNTVQAFVRGFVQGELAQAEAQRRTGLTERQWRARISPYVRHLIATGSYPHLTRIVVEAEDFPDPDAMFAWSLDRVLDGIAGIVREPRQA